jgi:2'-5' RNA ligase
MNTAMYYIAIVAPEAINEQVLQWKHFMRDRFGCTVALKSPAHVTLCSPFWMETALQPDIEKAITIFSSTQKDFSIELNNFGSFKPKVIFVHVEESPDLSQLQQNLETHLSADPLFPIKKTTRDFHPHITIANRDLSKSNFHIAWEFFRDKRYRVFFQGNAITLLKHNGVLWEVIYTASFSS